MNQKAAPRDVTPEPAEVLSEHLRRREMGFTERFEEGAERFYRETGFIAPGKSVPMEMWSEDHDRRRREAWDTFQKLESDTFYAALKLAVEALRAVPSATPSAERVAILGEVNVALHQAGASHVVALAGERVIAYQQPQLVGPPATPPASSKKEQLEAVFYEGWRAAKDGHHSRREAWRIMQNAPMFGPPTAEQEPPHVKAALSELRQANEASNVLHPQNVSSQVAEPSSAALEADEIDWLMSHTRQLLEHQHRHGERVDTCEAPACVKFRGIQAKHRASSPSGATQ